MPVDCRGHAVGLQPGRTLSGSVGTTTARNAITLVLPEIETVIAALAADLADSQDELRARVRLAYLSTMVAADSDDLEAAIDVLRARAAGDQAANPFGRRVKADSYDDLVEVADRAIAEGDLDLMTVLALQYQSGAIAAVQGQRLLLFRGVNAQIHRLMWEHGAAELARRGDGPERFIELGRWLMLWTQMSSLAVSEGYRDTEREFVARDVAARRAALDELIGSVPADTRARSRVRRLATRYGLDPDATYRVAAILPGPEVDPTPDEAGIDDEDLDDLARRLDQSLSRRGAGDRPDERDPGARGVQLAGLDRGHPGVRPARVGAAAGVDEEGPRADRSQSASHGWDGRRLDMDRHRDASRRGPGPGAVDGRAAGRPTRGQEDRPAWGDRRRRRARRRTTAAERPRPGGRGHRSRARAAPGGPASGR